MSPAQNTVFESGSGVAPGTLLTAIAASVLVLAFVWVTWVDFGHISGLAGRAGHGL